VGDFDDGTGLGVDGDGDGGDDVVEAAVDDAAAGPGGLLESVESALGIHDGAVFHMRDGIGLHLHAAGDIEDKAVSHDEVFCIARRVAHGHAFVAEVVHHAAFDDHIHAGRAIEGRGPNVHGVSIGAGGAIA
jgi:hypothetical protein